jgi:hypothetical protein
MNSALKTALLAFAKSIVDRGVVASGVALASYGVVDQSDLGNYDYLATGVIMALIGAGIGFYRDYGKQIIKDQLVTFKADADRRAAAATQKVK